MRYLAICGLIHLHIGVADAQDPRNCNALYEEYRTASDKGDVPGLRTVGERAIQHCAGASLLANATALFRAGDMRGTTLYIDSLMDGFSKAGAPILPIAYKIKGAVLLWAQDPGGALAATERGLLLADSSQFPREHIELLIGKAEVLINADSLADAMDVLHVADAIARRAGFAKGIAMASLNIGNIHFRQGRWAEAIHRYTDALSLAGKDDFTVLSQNAANNLAAVAVMRKEYARALGILDSLLADRTLQDRLFKAQLFSSSGYILARQGDHREALSRLNIAITMFQGEGDKRSLGKALQHRARSLRQLDRYDDAITTLQEALVLAGEVDDSRMRSEILWSLHELHYSTGHLAKALNYLRQQAELADSMNQTRFDDQLARSEILFGTAQKERRITEQHQALALAAAEDRRKSTQRNALIGATIALTLFTLLLFRSIRNRQRLATQEKQLHNEQIDQLLSQQEIKSINAMLEGQEKERDRVAKDLHDRLGSMLGGIKANMAALEDRVEQMRQDQQYQKVNRLLDSAVGELRQISHDMAAATLSRFGLEKALNDLRDTVHINGRLSVELKTFGLDERLERSVELAVYRMVQELVSNVLKHAKAQELSISVTRSPGRLSLVVTDDGVGFDTLADSHGMGLANVRSRAATLGATVLVDSTPGRGTSVSVECPVME